MQLKSYEAVSIQEAMTMIRKELGEDAVILSTNRKGNGFEVIAARDDAHISSQSVPVQPQTKRRGYQWIPEGKAEIGELQDAVRILFDLLGAGGRKEGDALSPLYYRLLGGGVSRAAACSLAEKMRLDDQTDAFTVLRKAIPASRMGRKRIRALVGPTGAGKTTTLAKLTAETAFVEKRSTAIITMDTHRIAATEQIRIYAKIMDIPMMIAPDKPSYDAALARFADRDVIYVDTPGRSHKDAGALEALNAILRSNPDTESSLVLSLTSAREHLLASSEKYGIFGSAQLIFTKLDECTRYGAMIDVIEKTGLPVSYWTTGQNVPDDIERATPEGIAELILGR